MITKSYIKMCEQAEEIQKTWRPKDCDIFCYTKSREIGEVCADNKKRTQKEYDENLKHQFWLPTLEQLFEMAGKTMEYDFIGCMPLVLNQKIEKSLSKYGIYNWGLSYKEIVLKYIMEELYDKTWISKKWVKS